MPLLSLHAHLVLGWPQIILLQRNRLIDPCCCREHETHQRAVVWISGATKRLDPFFIRRSAFHPAGLPAPLVLGDPLELIVGLYSDQRRTFELMRVVYYRTG